MTTPFWQIKRNKVFEKPTDFLSKDYIEADFKRGMHKISFNNKALSLLFAEKLGLDTIDKTNPEIERSILDEMAKEKCRYTYPDLIKEILKEQLFPNQFEHSMRFVETLYKSFHQHGLLYPGAQSIKNFGHSDSAENFPYLIGTNGIESQVNISLKEGEIILDEWTDITMIQKQRTNEEKTAAKQAGDYSPFTFIKNEDESPLMTVKNRISIIVNNDHLKYAHTDLTLQYNNHEIQKAYDDRSVVTKVIDFIKSIFKANGIKEFTAQKPVIEVVDMDNSDDQNYSSFNMR